MRYLFLLVAFSWQFSFSQNIEPFMIYNKKGQKVSTQKFLKSLEAGNIILFGEIHDNPIVHWLELKTLEYLNEKSTIAIGAEMFEADQQALLNDYLVAKITQKELDASTHLWLNYTTDYKPLLDFAKKNQLPFYATNVPRSHASYVYKNGLDVFQQDLSEENKQYVAPLPIAYDPELPGYKDMLQMEGHQTNLNFPQAQALKDATMAYFIYKNYTTNHNQFIHFNGDYHSKNFEGIYWYLKRQDKDLNIITISSVEQTNVKTLEEENKGRADFIIVIDKDMTKTY